MARDYNGFSQYHTSSTTYAGTTTWTVSAWINLDDTTSFQAIVGRQDSIAPNRHFQFRSNSANLQCIAWNSAGGLKGAVTSTSPLSSDTWHHVGGRLDSAQKVSVSVDGTVTINTSALTGTPSSDSVADTIGALYEGGSASTYFNGQIAWVALWDTDLSDEEFLILAGGAHPYLVRPESLQRFYPLDGGTAGDEFDRITGNSISESASSPPVAESPLVFLDSPWVVPAAAAAAARTVDATQGLIHLTGQNATVLQGREITSQQGLIHLIGQDATVLQGREVTSQQGLIHLIGQDATVEQVREITSQQGLIHLVGQDATVITTRTVTSQQGLIHLVGQDPTVEPTREVIAQQGLIHLIGQNSTVITTRTVTSQQGLIHVVGQDATVSFFNFQAAWARGLNRVITIGSRSGNT